MRTMCNIESSPKGHRVKLFVRGSTHYGPLRQCMSEAQGDLERVHMAGNGVNQSCSVRQMGVKQAITAVRQRILGPAPAAHVEPPETVPDGWIP